MFGWEYVLVFAFEFTPIVTIVNKTLLKLRFVKLIFEEICFYRNAAILNAVLKHTECSKISFLIYINIRGGSRNSSGGGGVLGRNSSRGGVGSRSTGIFIYCPPSPYPPSEGAYIGEFGEMS